jgi:hypothetical protein
LLEFLRTAEVPPVVGAVMDDLWMVLLYHSSYQALVGVVEASRHHVGRSFGNAEVIGRPF